jgi:hypothetical protein
MRQLGYGWEYILFNVLVYESNGCVACTEQFSKLKRTHVRTLYRLIDGFIKPQFICIDLYLNILESALSWPSEALTSPQNMSPVLPMMPCSAEDCKYLVLI